MSNQQENIRSLGFSSEKKFQPSCSSKQVYTSLLPVNKFKLNNMLSLSFCKIIYHLYHLLSSNTFTIFPYLTFSLTIALSMSHFLVLSFVGSYTVPFLIILRHIRTTLSYSSTLMMRQYLYPSTKLHAITSHLRSHHTSKFNIYFFLPTIESCFFMIVK